MNYEDNKHLVEEADKNDGYMKTLPTWWELRFSSICNQACRMCIPQTSSKIREEFAQYKDDLPEEYKSQTEVALKAFSKFGSDESSRFHLAICTIASLSPARADLLRNILIFSLIFNLFSSSIKLFNLLIIVELFFNPPSLDVFAQK